MKKIIVVIIIILFFVQIVPAESVKKQKTFKFTIFAEYLQPAEDRYSNIYGDNLIFPSARLGIRIFKFFDLFFSYGHLNQKGVLEAINEDTVSVQQQISAGGDLSFSLSKSIEIYLSGGIVYFMYSEDAMGESLSTEKMGYRGDVGIILNLLKSVYLEVSGGYTNGTDKVNDLDITLGGISARFGIGIRF